MDEDEAPVEVVAPSSTSGFWLGTTSAICMLPHLAGACDGGADHPGHDPELEMVGRPAWLVKLRRKSQPYSSAAPGRRSGCRASFPAGTAIARANTSQRSSCATRPGRESGMICEVALQLPDPGCANFPIPPRELVS